MRVLKIQYSYTATGNLCTINGNKYSYLYSWILK